MEFMDDMAAIMRNTILSAIGTVSVIAYHQFYSLHITQSGKISLENRITLIILIQDHDYTRLRELNEVAS